MSDEAASPVAGGDGSQHEDHHAFGPQWWERHHQEGAGEDDSTSPELVAEVAGLPVGTALDAGCGRGADAVWLARQGWQVTAVDVAPTAVSNARQSAERQGPDIATRICWVVADLTVWDPPQQYDLVVSQYVHPDLPFRQFVARIARAVAPGGTLLVVGHDHADGHSAAHAPEPASVGPDSVIGCLDPQLWDVNVAESRTRPIGHGSTRMSVHNLVVKASRRRGDTACPAADLPSPSGYL